MQGAVPPGSRVTYGLGQPVVAMHAPATVAAVAPQREVGFNPRHLRTMRNLSVLQIAIGVFCAIIYIVLLAIKRRSSSSPYSSSSDYHDEQSAGIWCGAVYIVAGSLGLAAARLNRLSLIVSAMILSIFSSIVLWIVIGFAAAAIDESVKNEDQPCRSYFSGYYYPYFSCVVHNFNGFKTADSILIILSAAELIVSIWCAVLCCKGSCKVCCSCCCYGSNYPYPTSVMYYSQAHSAGQQVIFVSQPGVPGSQAINIMPAQPPYLGMQQQPVLFAHPAAAAAAATAPPDYRPGVAEPPQYAATQMGHDAAAAPAAAAAYWQHGEVTKDRMTDGY